MKLYTITFDPNTFESGIDMIALTEDPAIEAFALRFSKEDKSDSDMKFTLNHDKQLIIGPAMIPDKKIYRREGEHEFYVVFTQEVIDKMLEKFKSEQRAIQLNFEHDENRTISGFVKEAWIVEDSEKDKSALYGFNLPVGTLMFSVKIDDKEIWESVVKKMDNVGFSVEGLMGIKYKEQFNKLIKNKNEMSKPKKRMFASRITIRKKYNASTKKFEEVIVTDENEVIIVEELKEGAGIEILTDEGVIETAPDGEYILEDEDVQIAVEDGEIIVIEEVKEPEVEVELEAEVETEEAEDEMLTKFVEFEKRIDALEAAVSALQDSEFKKDNFNKDKSKSERLNALRALVK